MKDKILYGKKKGVYIPLYYRDECRKKFYKGIKQFTPLVSPESEGGDEGIK